MPIIKNILAKIEFDLGNKCVIQRRFEDAISHYKKSAQNNYADAQYNLGFCYENGIGVGRNNIIATQYYQLASNNGISQAQGLLRRIRKPDADSIINHLHDNNINCFYHFTALENIDSIRNSGGLYSWYYCEQNEIQIPIAGGNNSSRDFDRQFGLQNYVRLSFCDVHPMSWQLRQIGINVVLLRISTEVALWQSTKFSDINATDRNHRTGSDFAFLRDNINIPATQRHYVSRQDVDFRPHQAEILVEEFIPVQYILNINNPLYLTNR